MPVGCPEPPLGALPHTWISSCAAFRFICSGKLSPLRVNGEAPDGPFFLRMPLACGRAAAHHPPAGPSWPRPPGYRTGSPPSPGQGLQRARLQPLPALSLPISIGTCALPRATVGKRGNRGWAGCRWCEPRTGWQSQRAQRTLSSRGGLGAGAGGCPPSCHRRDFAHLWGMGGGGLVPAHLCGLWPPPPPCPTALTSLDKTCLRAWGAG